MATAGDIQVLNQLIGSPLVFKVPDFQRNYSWESEQIDALTQDLTEASYFSEPHFIGSLITMKNVEDPSSVLVIDGQQRLTTIFMLVSALRDAVMKLETQELIFSDGRSIDVARELEGFLFLTTVDYRQRPRFEAHPMIAEMFRECIIASPSPSRAKLPKNHHNFSLKLRKGQKRLSEWVADEFSKAPSTEGKLEFALQIRRVLGSQISVLQIVTENTAEAFDIFMSLNSTGLPLGPSDLVKSEIFRILTKDLPAAERQVRTRELTDQWQVILTNLDSGNVDQFLRHYLLSSQPKKVQSRRIFPVFEEQIRGFGLGEGQRSKTRELLDTLIQASYVYQEILECAASSSHPGRRSLRTLLHIGASYRVLLLAVLSQGRLAASPDLDQLLSTIESFNLRWVLVGKNAQELESLYQLLANGLNSGALSIQDVIRRLAVEAPSDNSVAAVFNEQVLSSSLVKLILFRLEEEKSGLLTDFDPKSLHIDWIAPRGVDPNWIKVLFPEDHSQMELEYATTVEQWGNKVLIDLPVTTQGRSLTFSEKVAGTDDFIGYRNSTFQTTREICDLTNWDRRVIKQRNESIALSVCGVWRMI
jgi:hypothetical protein